MPSQTSQDLSARVPQLPSIKTEVQQVGSSGLVVKIYQDKSVFAEAMGKTQPYKSIPEKARPALESVADYVRRVMIPETFSREGPGWRPLAKRTQIERARAGYGAQHPILRRTGDLFQELTERSHPQHVETIKVGKYSRLEIGGSSVKFVQNQMGETKLNVPSRPMLPGTGNIPIGEKDRLAIKNIILKTLESGT